jgi:hypothetical protein
MLERAPGIIDWLEDIIFTGVAVRGRRTSDLSGSGDHPSTLTRAADDESIRSTARITCLGANLLQTIPRPS